MGSITLTKKLFYIRKRAPLLGWCTHSKRRGGIFFSRENRPLLNSLTLIFVYALKPLFDIKGICQITGQWKADR